MVNIALSLFYDINVLFYYTISTKNREMHN